MQTPRGFLIGAGVIAAIAALTSIGHPHTETAVETTAPIVTDAIEDTTTTNATTTDSQTYVLAEHVEAGINAGAAGADAAGAGAGASTTIELSNGDPAALPGDAMSTPAAETRQDSAASTTVDVRRGRSLAAGRSRGRQRAPSDEPGHHARADHDYCSRDHRAPDDPGADHQRSGDDDRVLGHAGHGAEVRRACGGRAEHRLERHSGDRAEGRRPRAGSARGANASEVKSTIAYDLPAA